MDLDQLEDLNSGFVQELFAQYLNSPESVDPQWREVFESASPGVIEHLPLVEREPAIPNVLAPDPSRIDDVHPEGLGEPGDVRADAPEPDDPESAAPKASPEHHRRPPDPAHSPGHRCHRARSETG